MVRGRIGSLLAKFIHSVVSHGGVGVQGVETSKDDRSQRSSQALVVAVMSVGLPL